MNNRKDTVIKSGLHASVTVIILAIFLMLSSARVNAEDKIVTQETLLDRIQIEDMIVRYYVDMSAGNYVKEIANAMFLESVDIIRTIDSIVS